MGHALFHRLLGGGDGGLVRGDGLGLRRCDGLVLVVVCVRDLLLLVEGLVAGKVGLVPLVGSLRLPQLGHGAVKVMLRGCKHGL